MKSIEDDDSVSSAVSFGDDDSVSSAVSFGDDDDNDDSFEYDSDDSFEYDGDIEINDGSECEEQHNPPSVGNSTVNDSGLRLMIEYNVHRQMISQRFIARLASWRSDNALIRKYHKSRHECTPEAIERAEALIAKRNNRLKRKNKLQDDITLFESCLKGGTFDFAHFDKYALTTQRRIRRFAKSLCERVSSMSEAEMDDPSSSTDLVLLCFSKTKFDCDQYLLALRERRLENDRLNRRAKREDKKKLQ